MSKASDTAVIIMLPLLVVAGIVIYFLNMDSERKEKKIAELQRDLAKHRELSERIRKMLHDLIAEHQDVDPKLANELTQIISLLNINQDASALMKLAKVVENLLKELYQDDPALKEKLKAQKRRKPQFADLLEHAKDQKVISADDYHLLVVLKGIRNEEAHELGVKKEVTRMAAAFVAGVATVMSLCRMLKRDTVVG
jgi:signal recognition particle subunit SEC65